MKTFNFPGPRKKFKGFALMADYPNRKGRTPEWDDDEALFNEKDDSEYLKSNNRSFTRTPLGYYLDDNGKYYDGIIYALDPETGRYTHYKIGQNKIEEDGASYDLKNIPQDVYDDLVSYGIDMNRFYKDLDEANLYAPNENIVFEENFNNGPYSINYKYPWRLTHNKYNQSVFEKAKRGNVDQGGIWTIEGPNGSFGIRVDTFRDGGSREVGFFGKNVPEDIKKYRGLIVNSPFNPSEKEAAEKNRAGLNEYLKANGYGLVFRKGGKLIERKKHITINK